MFTTRNGFGGEKEMSHFYGIIHGESSTPANRTGSKLSGITSLTQSKTLGINIRAIHYNDEDIFDLYLTTGQKGKYHKFLGTVKLKNGEPSFTLAPKRP